MLHEIFLFEFGVTVQASHYLLGFSESGHLDKKKKKGPLNFPPLLQTPGRQGYSMVENVLDLEWSFNRRALCCPADGKIVLVIFLQSHRAAGYGKEGWAPQQDQGWTQMLL